MKLLCSELDEACKQTTKEPKQSSRDKVTEQGIQLIMLYLTTLSIAQI
jgi:hypothetical protein